MPEIADVDVAIEARDRRESAFGAVVRTGDDRQAGARLDVRQAMDRVHLPAREAERCGALAGRELEGQHAHPDEVRAMDPLE